MVSNGIAGGFADKGFGALSVFKRRTVIFLAAHQPTYLPMHCGVSLSDLSRYGLLTRE